jgi:hypothetical protein
MGESDKKARGDEDKKLEELMNRYNTLLPKVNDTRQVCDSLWKAYKFTDELSPSMEWLVEKKVLATRDISSNGAGETEELIERQEKVIDQLDKKRKNINELLARGTKLKDDPKSPAFLAREVSSMRSQWEETNNLAMDRLDRLKANLEAWETYEKRRNDLFEKLVGADKELEDIKKIYDPAVGPEDLKQRLTNAVSIRKTLSDIFTTVSGANDIVQTLLTDEMKMELNEQVDELKFKMNVNDNIDEKLKKIEEFNGNLKEFLVVLEELEKWVADGRARMTTLTNPEAKFEGEERVLATMQLGDDIREKMEVHNQQQTKWEDDLYPSEAGEDTSECQAISSRMDTVKDTLEELNGEVEAEASKYGEDVKHLADFTNACKKFEPWMAKAETKVKSGLKKPESLEEAKELDTEAKTFLETSTNMKQLLDDGKTSADKMAKHDEPDSKYAEFVAGWKKVNVMAEAWVKRMDEMIKMWETQATTADKVNAALTAPADSDIKVEDLEGLLADMKKMFIEKQKMVDGLNVVPS